MWLPGIIRRRLDARSAADRAAGVREGLALAKARRDPTRYRYVFVVTYGRSGSTLVQGLVNSLPRTLLRGENDLYVLHLHRALASMRAWKADHVDHGAFDDTSAFYGLRALSPESIVLAINEIVTTSIVGRYKPEDYDVLGFKEVLWHRVEPEETESFFSTLDEAFPGARYILNTRDVDAAVKSGFWRRTDEAEARAKIARVREIQEHLRSTRAERCLDIRYEVLAGDDADARDALLDSLAEFVTDRRPDATVREQLLATLRKGHGPQAFARADKGGSKPPVV